MPTKLPLKAQTGERSVAYRQKLLISKEKRWRHGQLEGPLLRARTLSRPFGRPTASSEWWSCRWERQPSGWFMKTRHRLKSTPLQ